ncbi:MAG TPA: HupE/UreJ family protein [Burkholderiales bacterium]|nr:HupE/UreJ family protein [Burkholderiales bacterium]
MTGGIGLNKSGLAPGFFRVVWLLVSVVFSGAWGVGNALAHETKLSSTRMSISGAEISAQIELNAIDLNVATGALLTAADGKVDPAQLSKQLDAVQRYVADHVRLGSEGAVPCRPEWTSAAPKDDHVVLGQRWQCPGDGKLIYRVTLFHEIDPASRHMVSVDGDRKFIGLLSVQAPQMALTESIPSAWQTMQQYIVSGIEHIAIGYDHIAFLLAVIVLGRRFWPLVKVVTAFTIAHSITLTLAVLGIVSLPSALVETLIAASIVYVAAENFFVKDIRHRWWLTFLFGLIHGFGFASVLRDYGLPEGALALALASFNIGVEIGQLLIVVVAILIWQTGFRIAAAAGFQRTGQSERRVSLVISGAVLVAGLYWLGQRLQGF